MSFFLLYSIIRNTDDTDHLQADLKKLEEWESKWQMSFNVQKCYLLTVTKKHNSIPTSYSLHNHTLERVPEAKYLGSEIN